MESPLSLFPPEKQIHGLYETEASKLGHGSVVLIKELLHQRLVSSPDQGLNLISSHMQLLDTQSLSCVPHKAYSSHRLLPLLMAPTPPALMLVLVPVDHTSQYHTDVHADGRCRLMDSSGSLQRTNLSYLPHV